MNPMKPESNTDNPESNIDSSRLKLWEAVAAVLLVTFACLSVAVTFLALTVRYFVLGVVGIFFKGVKP